jgi:hypothetical protein
VALHQTDKGKKRCKMVHMVNDRSASAEIKKDVETDRQKGNLSSKCEQRWRVKILLGGRHSSGYI